MPSVERARLTAALADRQLLLERAPLGPAEAIRRLTPLQGQEPRAPFFALAARLEGFSRAALEAVLSAAEVVKTTVMRNTLHLACAEDYGAYHQFSRQARLRAWRKQYVHLDEEAVTAELRAWMAEPRTNGEIRERVGAIEGVEDTPWAPVMFIRTLLPLVQLPPAGHWSDPRRSRFVADPRPEPSPADAATLVLERYLGAFGPAGRRDVAAWAGVAQRDFAEALERLVTVSHRDENGAELLDLPGRELPPATVEPPVRLLGHWDQTMLAYADRARIMPPEVQALKLTISGDPVVTVRGRVAASWSLAEEDGGVRIEVTPHVELRRRDREAIRSEARYMARVCMPEAPRVEVVGV